MPRTKREPPQRRTAGSVHAAGAEFCQRKAEVLLRLEGILEQTGAGHALLLAQPALHAEIDCERQLL